MFGRLLVAIAVFIIVGLGLILLGMLLMALGVPILATLGAFLEKWAWVLAFACALLAFASGTTWASLRARF